jgi:hypothetical protein
MPISLWGLPSHQEWGNESIIWEGEELLWQTHSPEQRGEARVRV